MGNGLVSALTDEQKDILRVEYESTLAQGVSDDSEIQARLQKKYAEMKEEVSDLPTIDPSAIQGQEVHKYFAKGDNGPTNDPMHSYFQELDKKDTALATSSSMDTLDKSKPVNITAPSGRRASFNSSTEASALAVKRLVIEPKETKKAFGAREPEDIEKRRSLTTQIVGTTDSRGRRGSLDQKLMEGAKKVMRVRRMSMDVSGFKNAEEMEKMKADLANQVAKEDELNVDTWASVTIQPTCAVCSMAFASDAKKDQHIKFSHVHAMNLKKLEDSKKPAPAEEEAVVIIEDVNTSLIYAGHKLFWRTRMNIDVHLFMHVKANPANSVIEVVLYNSSPDKQLELPRIFLKMAVLLDIIKEEEILAKFAEMAKNRASDELANMDKTARDKVRREEATRAVISSFVLTRLVQDPNNGDNIFYKMSTLDDPSKDPLWTGAITLDPTRVNRRKSVEDADAFLKAHLEHFDSLNAFNEVARKHSVVVQDHLEVVDSHNAAQAQAAAQKGVMEENP